MESENSRTVYSFICDLKKGDIYIYNYHDFSNPLIFNLEEQLSEGYHEHYLGQLFNERNPNYEKFIEESPVKMIEMGYGRNTIAALMFYRILKSQYPKALNKSIGINTLSQIGKNLLENNNPQDAITFLEQNKNDFPDSARSHFELANTYLISNSKEKAIVEYKNTLAINPNHKQADKELDKLLHQ